MSESVYDKSKKSCLICFGNKKVNSFDFIKSLTQSFAARGYYFEKTAYVSFNNPFEITCALKDGLANHENLVVACPLTMKKTITDFITDFCGCEFDGLGVLKSAQNSVYVLVSDSVNKLTVDEVCDNLDCKYQQTFAKAIIKTVGAQPNILDDALKDGKSCCPELDFNINESYGDCRTEVIYGEAVSKSEFDRAFRAIVKRLQGYIYALEDVSLEERLCHLLKLRRMKISTAESFTGGGVGGRIVRVSGASEVYFEGLNTYSNEAKSDRLGVEEFTLKSYGAVSKETAAQMAEGLINAGNCDIAISTTGIAGPKTDNTNKPVGLAYIAVATSEQTKVYEYNLKGDRENITQTAINLALFAAFKTLK